MADDGLNDLRERLLSHSQCFNSLLELIPPKYYFSDNEEEQGKKFYKNKKNKAPKQAVKGASKKAKLSRLDPAKHKSVIELQTELSTERTKDGNLVSVEDVDCSDIVDLRRKLHERIELLKKKRKATSAVLFDTERPTKKARKKVKEEKNIKKISNRLNSGKVNGKEGLINKKPITNNEGKVVFSKFDFTTDVAKTQLSGKKMKKNYKKLLEKAENRKKKLEEIRVSDVNKAKELVKKATWRKALDKAEGVKQKDDPTLLKKSVKRKEKVKSKHQKEWKARIENQKKQMKEKQQLREKNIKERIDNKKKMKKKGGRTPGF